MRVCLSQSEVPAAATSRASDVAAGLLSSFAVVDGNVVGWGLYDQSAIPASAQSGDIRNVAANSLQVYALTNAGGLISWNAGDATSSTIPLSSGVTAISANSIQALALVGGAAATPSGE